jgi:Family of unknown function (DUF6152)
MTTRVRVGSSLGLALAAVLLLAVPIRAHHSFAMYDMTVTKVFTGVVTRVSPDVNHLQIFFAPMLEDRTNVERDEAGEPIVWIVEMGSSSTMARQGISVNTFPRGTIFSVAVHPLRNGENAGSRDGAMFRCPAQTPPRAGMHCDSVEGSTLLGTGELRTPSEE